MGRNLEALKKKCYAYIKGEEDSVITYTLESGDISDITIKDCLDAFFATMDEKRAKTLLSVDGLETVPEWCAGGTVPFDIAPYVLLFAMLQREEHLRANGWHVGSSPAASQEKIEKAFAALAAESKELSVMPNAQTVRNLVQFLNNPIRQQSTRKVKVTYAERDKDSDTQVITYESQNETNVLKIRNFTRDFSKQVRNGGKVFKFAMQEANKQGTIRPVFTLQQLVDLKMYSTVENAYTGLSNVVRKLEKINIELEWKRKGVNNKGNRGGALIGFKDINFKQCSILLHEDICRAAACYYTIFPRWGYALPDGSFNLLDYFFSMARKNTDQLKKQRYFDIKLDTIRIAMGLPSPKDTQRHTHNIREPIEKAIAEIEDEQTANGADLISFEWYYEDTKKIEEYLQGKIRVFIHGNALQYMISREDQRTKEIRAAKKRTAKKKGVETNEAQN